MNQNKTNLLPRGFCILMGVFLSLSCSPKKDSVRATVKTEQTNLNPAVSTAADQQATATNSIYKIVTVSLPEFDGSAATVVSELLNPSSQYLPITTRHDATSMLSQGIYNDSTRGLQLRVVSRCNDAECSKYVLLVTVTRSNVAVYQSGAISFKEDCNFYTISTSASTGMFASIDAFESKYASLQPKNDGASCNQ